MIPLKQLTAARENTEKTIEYAHSQLARVEKQHRRNYASLEKCVRRYYETGIAFATQEAQQAIGLTGQKPKLFFQELARELNRPMLNSYAQVSTFYVAGWKRVHSIILKVPRTKAMENMVGGLLLLSTESTSPADWHTKPVTHTANSRSWEFYFNEKEGREHFLRFMRTCKENPVARIALKLPVLPTE